MRTNYDEWCNVSCRHCKYNKYDSHIKDKKEIYESDCKRINHNDIWFFYPYFITYDCGRSSSICCSDFEPSDSVPWLKKHWGSIKIIKPEENETLGLKVANDHNLYRVKYLDFYYNDFINPDGSLKWVCKLFYKRRQSGLFGYELMCEYPDGKIFHNGEQDGKDHGKYLGRFS